MNPPILKVKNLKKYFPIRAGFFKKQVGVIKAVDDISFEIEKGSVLGMVGESGSGKSTAGRVAMRLIEPTEGDLEFNGEHFLSLKGEALKYFRHNIQMVFQDPYSSLNPRKAIYQSIGESLLYHGIVQSRDEQLERVAEIMGQVGLSPDYMFRYPHQFSGGQQQRICIGRAIAMKPKLIICDEAVSALDVSVQAQILNLLMELKEEYELSYLFISHDLSVVRHISDHVVVMNQGKIVESGTVEEVFHHAQNDYTRKLLKAIPITHPKNRAKKIQRDQLEL